MARLHYFFAGGGTGGHIYPGIAVAEQIKKDRPDAKITFFCSGRQIDSRIMTRTNYEHIALPARGFSTRPDKFVAFCASFWESYTRAHRKIAEKRPAVLLGIGGFVSGPVVLAAHRLKVPVCLLNLDIVPGRANKVLARYAKEIFVQFEETKNRFDPGKTVTVVGCPLRAEFSNPNPERARRVLGLDEKNKTLLITGGSSGAASINKAACSVLDRLVKFAEEWQIVHLAGPDARSVKQEYEKTKLNYKVLYYFDDMPDLMAAADLVVGRAGAVSVAEYVAAGVPSICLPYPYHKDRHQYLNAEKLVQAGCAVIVEDLADRNKTAERLASELVELMGNETGRSEMSQACRKISKLDAAAEIARRMGGERS
jgi:UDP-N-acetylglucosamine--N-acetylmuramyl-(pentapeptide) pyrophosphoryl-undecaprenol N-acetylglucosamine transferase